MIVAIRLPTEINPVSNGGFLLSLLSRLSSVHHEERLHAKPVSPLQLNPRVVLVVSSLHTGFKLCLFELCLFALLLRQPLIHGKMILH